MSWYGILFISDCGEIAQPNHEVQQTPLHLSQCDSLLGKKFRSISNDGDNIIICCEDGNFMLSPNGTIETLYSDQRLVSVNSGDGFSVGISESGRLYSWGWKGECGQLGHGANLKKVFQPLEISFKNSFSTINCGKAFSIALDEIGQAYAWGENFDRQLGIYNKSKNSMHLQNAMVEEMVFCPRLIPLSLKTPLSKVSCGERFAMAITKDGDLYSWGAGESGQLGTGRCTMKDVPSKVNFGTSSISHVVDVACGDGHTIALLDDKRLFSWGLNHRGQCGVNDIKARYVPEALPNVIDASKIYASIHSSAAIDNQGKLWTWGSTRNGRLLHTVEEIQTRDEHQSLTGSVCSPTQYYSEQFENSRWESFCFAKSRVGILMKTTITKVWPMKGPKRTFNRLYIHGFGLWRAQQIIVKFSSQIPSIYNPPRSCMGKLLEPGVIVCKPPKFAEVGVYTIEVSMDGGKEFLSQTFQILVYKEVIVSQQVPTVIDLRQNLIPQLLLKAHGSQLVLGSSMEYQSVRHHNENQGMEITEEDGGDTATVKLLFNEISSGQGPNSKPQIQFTTIAPVIIESTISANSEDGTEEKLPTDGQLTIACANIDLSQIDALSHGLYEVFCLLSFNNQDFPPLTKEATFSVCHSFHPLDASPCSYSFGELDRLVDVFHRQENCQVDSFEALQDVVDYHLFERKIVVTGESMFPSNKLQKGSHIMAVVSKCTLSHISSGNIGNQLMVDKNALSALEELIVHGDSTTAMHFTLNSSYLRQVHALVMEQSKQINISIEEYIIKVFFIFQIETPSINGVEKVQLSEHTVPFFFFPIVKPSLSRCFFSRVEDPPTVSFLQENGEGFPFNPACAVVRMHIVVDGISKVVFEVPAEKTKIYEIVKDSPASNNEEENDGHSNQQSLTYAIDACIPSFEEYSHICASLFSNSSNIESFVKTSCLSLSLDGISIPQEHEWIKILYFSPDLAKYTLQSSVPKGGAVPGSQVNLVLSECIPIDLGMWIRVRLRGADASICSHPISVQLTEQVSPEGVISSILSFNIPDSASIAQIPPTMNGKEKLYFIDISVDRGNSFESAAAPLLQIK